MTATSPTAGGGNDAVQPVAAVPCDHPSAWKAARWQRDTSWIRPFGEDELQALDEAVAYVRARGLDPLEDGAAAFPLPGMAGVFAELLAELEGGRGFVLLRGLDLSRHDAAGVRLLNAGLFAHLGRILRQNSRGDRVGEVRDRGARYGDTGVRGHVSNHPIAPHCDTADIVGLLCVHPAARGGASCIASSTAIYNALCEGAPELLPVLMRGFRINLAGKGPSGDPMELSNHRIPVFSVFQGLVSCRYNRKQIEDGAAILGQPLTPLEQRAVSVVGELALDDEFRLDMAFSPGDVQLLNNHCVLHSRRGFSDGQSVQQQRLLLRTWVNMRDGRPLAAEFADRLNTGPRGEVAVTQAAE
jgi:hypothetical protein